MVDRVQRLSLSREEFYVLKALILANSDAKLDEPQSLQRFRDSILMSLSDCVGAVRPGQALRASQHMFLVLPGLRQTDGIVRKFWSSVYRTGKLKANITNFSRDPLFDSCNCYIYAKYKCRAIILCCASSLNCCFSELSDVVAAAVAGATAGSDAVMLDEDDDNMTSFDIHLRPTKNVTLEATTWPEEDGEKVVEVPFGSLETDWSRLMLLLQELRQPDSTTEQRQTEEHLLRLMRLVIKAFQNLTIDRDQSQTTPDAFDNFTEIYAIETSTEEEEAVTATTTLYTNDSVQYDEPLQTSTLTFNKTTTTMTTITSGSSRRVSGFTRRLVSSWPLVLLNKEDSDHQRKPRHEDASTTGSSGISGGSGSSSSSSAANLQKSSSGKWSVLQEQ
ncbi:unnamed protein product [Trichogramma brassicae]|uniref:NR LBD domain-containing protein n=1 Tax=Trichogramma brassicae TaxID=86971 RepID=A0A6H5IB03_9HYME|nr:unnamed protein product [Trichogramma brassicae]